MQRVTLCCNMLSWHVAHIIATQLVPARCPSTHTSPRCVPPTTASRVRHAARCSAFGRRVATVACIAEWAFHRYDVELFQRIEELLGRKMDECAAAPPTSAPRPHLHRDWTHPLHICIGTGLTRATSAPGLRPTRATSALHCAAIPQATHARGWWCGCGGLVCAGIRRTASA